MVATRGRTFKRPWRRSYHSSKLKSSSAPTGRKDSWCFHAVGSSNAPLLGSTAAEGLPRIGRTSIATRWRSCGLPQSASCSENFVIPPDVFGQTLRSAILTAVREAGQSGLSEDEFGRRVQSALGFVADNQARRQEWMLDPESKGVARVNAEQSLARVLAYRVWVDQRRGWRFTNPNLEELGLIRADYVSIDDLAADDAAFADAPPELRNEPPQARKMALLELLNGLRHGLAITADALDAGNVESIATASR